MHNFKVNFKELISIIVSCLLVCPREYSGKIDRDNREREYQRYCRKSLSDGMRTHTRPQGGSCHKIVVPGYHQM